jgi:2-polyprenyl-3-methyl-5-hydroxy-6-metoxy-1,4-benzoquinol methylase
MNTSTPSIETIKARHKAMWESGDFGEVAKTIMPCAEEFMARLPLRPGLRVLDVACGSGNLAIVAARGLKDKAGVSLPDALKAVGVDFERVKESGVN